MDLLHLLAVKQKNREMMRLKSIYCLPHMKEEDQLRVLEGMQEINLVGRFSEAIKARNEKRQTQRANMAAARNEAQAKMPVRKVRRKKCPQ